jgi:peptidylprolyl isomerase
MDAAPGADAFVDRMTTFARCTLVLALLGTLGACRLKEEAPPSGEAAAVPAPPDVAAPPADALKTPSGLASKILRVGLGEIKPKLKSTVVVHYTGWTTDGKMFDTSIDASPITFPMIRPDGLPSVIPGWMEALQLMRAGEKRRVWIPSDLAYGKIPDAPGQRPNPKGMLVFDMELLQIR